MGQDVQIGSNRLKFLVSQAKEVKKFIKMEQVNLC